MKKLMMFISTRAIVLLFSMTLNAQSTAPTLEQYPIKKNIFSYDVTKAIDYAPVNLSYQRTIGSQVALTTSIGFFNASKADNIETGIKTTRDAGNTGWLLLDIVDALVDGDGDPKAFQKEYNQKGQYLTAGLRLYTSEGKMARFYLEPEFSVYHYKADLQTSTLRKWYDEDLDKYVDQRLTVKEIKNTIPMGKMNFGFHLLSKKGISADLSMGIGVVENKDEDGINEDKFGPSSAINGSGVFDLELKVGYGF